MNNGGCSPNGTCTNAVGGRSCTCKTGFSGDGINCADIDECQSANGGCSPNATCANTLGSRTCTCKPGFAGDGIACGDVDECATANGGCSSDAACMNTSGSRVCTCQTGFTGDGFSCTDVNECATANGGCSPAAICTNTVGSRTCACKPLYTGNGVTCTPQCGIEQACCAGSACSGDLVCAGEICHCLARIDGNFFIRGNGTVVDARTAGQYGIAVDVNGTPLNGVLKISEGVGFACALRNDGSVWCWARDNIGWQGQLGTGPSAPTPSALNRAYRVQVEPAPGGSPQYLDSVADLSTSTNYGSTTCAVRSDKTVWCWGANPEGMMFPGRGTGTLNYAAPIMLTPFTMLSGVDRVSVGGYHICVLRSGVPACWGRNYDGALGTGDAAERTYATAIAGVPPLERITASHGFTCGSTSDGRLYCWGLASHGQVGDLDSAAKQPGCLSKCQLVPDEVQTITGINRGPLRGIRDHLVGSLFTMVHLDDGSYRYYGLGFPHRPEATDLPVGLNKRTQWTIVGGSVLRDDLRYYTTDARYFVGTTQRHPSCPQ